MLTSDEKRNDPAVRLEDAAIREFQQPAFDHSRLHLGCDAYVGCFHKWILAPAGNGFIYVRREREKDVWSSIASSQWDNHNDDGYRFTQGLIASLTREDLELLLA